MNEQDNVMRLAKPKRKGILSLVFSRFFFIIVLLQEHIESYMTILFLILMFTSGNEADPIGQNYLFISKNVTLSLSTFICCCNCSCCKEPHNLVTGLKLSGRLKLLGRRDHRS